MRFSLFNIPIPYKTTKGSFSGYWVTLDAQCAGEHETVGTYLETNFRASFLAAFPALE